VSLLKLELATAISGISNADNTSHIVAIHVNVELLWVIWLNLLTFSVYSLTDNATLFHFSTKHKLQFQTDTDVDNGGKTWRLTIAINLDTVQRIVFLLQYMRLLLTTVLEVEPAMNYSQKITSSPPTFWPSCQTSPRRSGRLIHGQPSPARSTVINKIHLLTGWQSLLAIIASNTALFTKTTAYTLSCLTQFAISSISGISMT